MAQSWLRLLQAGRLEATHLVPNEYDNVSARDELRRQNKS